MMKQSESTEVSGDVQEAGARLGFDSLRTESVRQGAVEGFPVENYLHARSQLKYDVMCFPLGYPVRLLSNSNKVLAAAEQSWGCFHEMFHCEPLEVLIEERQGADEGATLPPAPAHMLHGHLLLEVADTDNFFIADLKAGRSMGRVTPAAAECSAYLRYFFLEAAALSMIASMRAIAIHGACVRAGGKGALLCGDSGEGKSTLAYAGTRAGWTYVSDDATYIPIHRDDRLAIGNCMQIRFRPSCVALFPELAGHSITPRAAGKPSIEIRTSEWPEFVTSNTTQIDHIVFLNRRHADTQKLTRLQSSSVLPWFEQHLLSAPETRPAQEATILRLLDASVFELRYRELTWAINRINELAEKGN